MTLGLDSSLDLDPALHKGKQSARPKKIRVTYNINNYLICPTLWHAATMTSSTFGHDSEIKILRCIVRGV